jgi:hypothetical protein
MPVPTNQHTGPSGLATMARTSARCGGTPIFALNKNTKLAQTDPDDPYALFTTAAAGNDLNVIAVDNPGFAWLEAYPLISGATAPGTALQVNFFGYVTNHQGNQRNAHMDVDPTNFDDSLGNFFCPLLLEQGKSKPAVVVFDNLVIADKNDVTAGAKQMQTLTPRYIFVGGVDKIVALVSTPHDLITAGVLLGRFTNGAQ